MTFTEQTIKIRKQTFYLILTELMRANPDRDIAHLVHVASQAAQNVSALTFDPTLGLSRGGSDETQCL